MLFSVVSSLRGGLIVSCQAPAGSPLNDPYVIAAMALAAQMHGAVGVRINGPANIAAVHQKVKIPVIGIEKIDHPGCSVYITPTFSSASAVVSQGADIVALDATRRARPGGEKIEHIILRAREQLRIPVMADISSLDEGLYAADCGADLVATTLCSFTEETALEPTPAYHLVEQLASRPGLPVILEGGLASAAHVRRAFEAGAFAVVAGTALTGIDHLIRSFVSATPRALQRDFGD